MQTQKAVKGRVVIEEVIESRPLVESRYGIYDEEHPGASNRKRKL